ncbi:MAG: hypothetical protein PVH61_39580 [Candidatus Aminicenantes bacterium]|jgi:hypothetical protein
MHIVVENEYIFTDDTFINVYCRKINDPGPGLSIEPRENSDDTPNSIRFPDTDGVKLYVKETRGPAPIRKRFGYIKVSMLMNTETKWQNGNTLSGGVSVIGNYDPDQDKCEAVVRIVMVGPTRDVNKPTTVNVQVGGN